MQLCLETKKVLKYCDHVWHGRPEDTPLLYRDRINDYFIWLISLVFPRESIPNLRLFLLPFSVLSLADRSVWNNRIQSMAYVCHGFLPQNSNVLCYNPFLIILNTIYSFWQLVKSKLMFLQTCLSDHFSEQ